MSQSSTPRYSDFKNLLLLVTSNILNAVTTDLINNNITFFQFSAESSHLKLLQRIVIQCSIYNDDLNKNNMTKADLFKHITSLSMFIRDSLAEIENIVANPISKENLQIAFNNCMNSITSIENIATTYHSFYVQMIQ